jgi:hypothetical protein
MTSQLFLCELLVSVGLHPMARVEKPHEGKSRLFGDWHDATLNAMVLTKGLVN